MTHWIEKHLNRWIWIGLAMEAAVLVAAYLESGGDWLYFFRSAARLSGRVSLLFYTIVIVYFTLQTEVSDYPLRVKQGISANFAILHMIHWVLLATAIYVNAFDFPILRLIPGSLAYIAIVAAPFMFQPQVFSMSSVRRFQQVYLYLPWLIFFLTYLTRLSGNAPTATGSFQAYIPLMIFTTGLLIWHFGYRLLQRKKI